MINAIYTRVSTQIQATDGHGIDTQVELCMQHLLKHGINPKSIQIFRDEGISGEEIERPELNKLRDLVANGGVSRIIMTHPDRLSRDMIDKLYLVREFEKNDVELLFTDTDYSKSAEGMLFFNILSAIAQYELQLIRKRTIRGRLHVVDKEKKIMPMRVPPYGYDWVDCSLIINEKEAAFVQKIYHWYVFEQISIRQIGELLYREGATPKRGESRNFSSSSIHRILTSEIYIGIYRYNQRKTKKIKGEYTKSRKTKRTYEFRDASDVLEVEVPAIISKQLFEMAKKRAQQNKTKRKESPTLTSHLLKGMLRCAKCGRIWESTTYSGGKITKESNEKVKHPIYRCPNMFPKRYGENVEKCICKTIRAELLDEYVWNAFICVMSSPEIYFSFQDTDNQEIKHSEIKKEIESKQLELDKLQHKKERIKHLYYDGVLDLDEMKKDLLHISRQMEHLVQLINKLQSNISQPDRGILHPDEIIQKLERFREISYTELSFEQKRELLKHVIDEIIVLYTPDDTYHLTIHGILNNLILHFDQWYCTQHQEI